MNSNQLKTRVRFSTTIDKDVNEKLKALSRETMIPISKLIDLAILSLIKNGINSQSSEN